VRVGGAAEEPLEPDRVAVPATRSRPSLHDAGLVVAGGSAGTITRVWLAERFPTAAGAFPWTTFGENVVGSFLLGLLLTVLAERLGAAARVRLLVCTGALGAFTTYSTLAVELTGRLGAGRVALAAAYAAATLVVGVLAALLGMRLARGREPS
jgi:fluoride exporter